MVMKAFKNMNLRVKLTVTLVAFVLVPLMLAGMLFYNSSRSFVSERTDESTAQLLELLRRNVDQTLNEYENHLLRIYDHEDVIRELARPETSGEGDRATGGSVDRFLRDFLRGKEGIDSAYVLTEGGAIHFADFKGSELFLQAFRKHPEWGQRIRNADGRIVWLSTYELEPNPYKARVTHLLPVGVQIKNIADVMQPLGAFAMNIDIQAFDAMLKDVKVSPKGIVLIADRQGNVVWHSNPEAYRVDLAVLPAFGEIAEGGGTFADYRLNGDAYRVGSIRSQKSDWIIYSFVPHSDLDAQTENQKQFLFVTIVAFAALFIVLGALTSIYISRPIMQMAVAMKQIHKEHRDFRLPAQSTDEMGLLQSSFNYMRDRIRDLIQEVRSVSDKEKEAEIRALQAQINPHFVYNTLDTINWMAIERGQRDMSSMITALGDILRYAIKPGGAWVSAEEEMKWAQSYAYLQETRFEGRFAIEFRADPEALPYKVPRLLLQPYLENAVLHGMEDTEAGGVIRVEIALREAERRMRVTIRDNGVGISEERLRFIQDRKHYGIGIYNIDDRLKLEFGPDYGVTVRSEPGLGTEIEIVLPCIA
ncbi:sensor histidine kinase [Paenibacillus antri]|uniref:histidine kinase n=1 Tax=Paenibacillus antri TaxID=2582848 RepID=A0A5R9FZP4_9BACL|nr:sensor histidine kinase [Paenibacillus antri]TLS49532.1 sensor histidine kinase [Paenibacillus antri]